MLVLDEIQELSLDMDSSIGPEDSSVADSQGDPFWGGL
jgi:hypothetical protein